MAAYTTSIIIALWTMSLSAMSESLQHISTLELRLITNQIARGIHVEIPHKGKIVKYFLNPFHFTLLRRLDSPCKALDLLIKTADQHKLIQLTSCPLIPGTTTSGSFTYNDETYTVAISKVTKQTTQKFFH